MADPDIVVLHPDGRVVHGHQQPGQSLARTVAHLMSVDAPSTQPKLTPVPGGWCISLRQPDPQLDNPLADYVLGRLDPALAGRDWRGPVALSWQLHIEELLDDAAEHGLTVTREGPDHHRARFSVDPQRLVTYLAGHGWRYSGIAPVSDSITLWLGRDHPSAALLVPLALTDTNHAGLLDLAVRDLARHQQCEPTEVLAALTDTTDSAPHASSDLDAVAEERDHGLTDTERQLRADFTLYQRLGGESAHDPEQRWQAQELARGWLAHPDPAMCVAWIEADATAHAWRAHPDTFEHLNTVLTTHPWQRRSDPTAPPRPSPHPRRGRQRAHPTHRSGRRTRIPAHQPDISRCHHRTGHRRARRTSIRHRRGPVNEPVLSQHWRGRSSVAR